MQKIYRRLFATMLAFLLLLTCVPLQVFAETWTTTADSKVNVSLKYTQSTSADPALFEINADSVSAINVLMQVNYDTNINTFEEVFPVGSVTITIPLLFGLRPEVSEVSHFSVLSYNDGNGNLVMTNQRPLSAGSSGFFTIGYQINTRSMTPNAAGDLEQNDIKATVKATLGVLDGTDDNGEPVYRAGEVIEQQSAAIRFLAHLKRDEFSITKTAKKIVSVSKVDVPDDTITESDYYMVNYNISVNATNINTISLSGAEIRDVIPQNGILLFVKGKSGATYYNHYASPTVQDSRLTYNTSTRQLTVKLGVSSYSTSEPLEQLTVFVAFKKSDVNSQPNISNTATLNGYYENETVSNIAQLNTSTATVNISDYAFSYGSVGVGMKKQLYNTSNVLSGNTLSQNVAQKALFRIQPNINDAGIGTNLIIRDDILEVRDETGYYQLGAGDYNITTIEISGSKLSAFETARVSVLRAGQTEYEAITVKKVFSTITAENPYEDVIAVQIEFVNISDAIALTNLNIDILFYIQPDILRGKTTADQLRNLAMLDVVDPATNQSLITIEETSYNDFTAAERARVMQRDLDMYGKYVYHAYGDCAIKWNYADYSVGKGLSKLTYDPDMDALTGTYNVNMYGFQGSVPLKNFTIVDILPQGMEFAGFESYIKLDEIFRFVYNGFEKTPDCSYEIIDNYQNSGRQAVIITCTSDPNDDTQGSAPNFNFMFQMKTIIRDYSAFLNDVNLEITNNVRLILDDYENGDLSNIGANRQMTNDGVVHTNENSALWIDTNGDGKSNPAFDAYGTSIADFTTYGGSQDINKYVDTDQTDTFFMTKQATASVNTDFTYLLNIKANEGSMKNIVLFDELPRVGDQMYSPAGSRGSTLAPVLQSIDVSDAVAKGFSPVVYVTESETHSETISDSSWVKLTDYATPNDLSKIKAVAVDLGSKVLMQGQSVAVYLTMNGGDNHNKIAVNTYYYFRDLDESNTGTWIRNTAPLETNKVSVTVKAPNYTIGDTVFADVNGNGVMDSDESGVRNVSVGLYRVVGGQPESSALKTTTTDSSGKYSFSDVLVGEYVVKFALPNGYSGFSVVRNNYNTNAAANYNSIDQSGYTDTITLNANYPHADAGLIPAISATIVKTADQVQAELGGTASFTITGVRNSNSYAATNFIFEEIPHAAMNAKSMTIPAYYNASDVIYTVYYKSNYATNWTAVSGAKNLAANAAHTIDFESMLQQGEKITNIKVDFGAVPAQFTPMSNAGIKIVFNISGHFSDYDDLPVPSEETRMADNNASLTFTAANQEKSATDDAIILVDKADDIDRTFTKTAADMYVALGGTTSFTIDGIQNFETVNAYAFTLTDTPQAGLYFDTIHMPAFTNGSGVTYSVFYSTETSNNLIPVSGAQNLSADTAHDIVFPADAAADARKLTIQFGTVPVGFASEQPVVMDFTVDEDLEVFPNLSARNDAKLSYMASGERVELEDGDELSIDDLNVQKASSVALEKTLRINDEITYTIMVENNGSVPYTDLQVIDSIPAGTSFVTGSASGGGIYDSDQKYVAWTIDRLAPGEKIELQFKVKITKDGVDLKVIQNKAYVNDNPTNEVINVVDEPVVVVPPQPTPNVTATQPIYTGDTNLSIWISVLAGLLSMGALVLLSKKRKTNK